MSNNDASLMDRLKSWPLVILPHQLLSLVVRSATRWRSGWWKNPLIRQFIRHFNVDMSEAESASAEDYTDFNHFFTRTLKPGARSFPADQQAIVSPVDGRVSQAGDITNGRLIQAKGIEYSLTALLGAPAADVTAFATGAYLTIYLAPHNYHRVHMPIDGSVTSMTYLPGRRFAVNRSTARTIPGLFSGNERLACDCVGTHGQYRLIFVGAMNVASISTAWAGEVLPGAVRTDNGPPFFPAAKLWRLGSWLRSQCVADGLKSFEELILKNRKNEPTIFYEG